MTHLPRSMPANTITRRGVMVGLLAAVLTPERVTADGDEVTVPLGLQVDLLGRAAAYDRTFAAADGAEARILVVQRSGSAVSARAAAQLDAAMGRMARIGTRPARSSVVTFTGAAALRAQVERERAAIVYLTPGLGEDVARIAAALEGVPVLTVSAVSTDADRGAVLSFELIAARPKLVVNLRQARRQRVEFMPQLLRLARVIP